MLPPKSRPLIVLLAVFVLLALIDFRAGVLRPLEHRLSDLLHQLDARTRTPDPDIVIVEIDDASLTRMAELADRISCSCKIGRFNIKLNQCREHSKFDTVGECGDQALCR